MREIGGYFELDPGGGRYVATEWHAAQFGAECVDAYYDIMWMQMHE